MKISSETLGILRNFGSINKGIIFKAGNVVKVISQDVGNNFNAKAVTKETFPRDFAIADVPKFVNLVGMFDEPDLEFTDDRVVVTDQSGKKLQFRYGEEKSIKTVNYEKTIKLPSEDVTFTLTKDQQSTLSKALSSLQSTVLKIEGDGEKIIGGTEGRVNAYSFSIDLGKTDRIFTALFSLSTLNIIPQDYEVSLMLRDIILAQFAANPTYYIPAEIKSKVIK